MHSVWRTQELLQLILENLSPFEWEDLVNDPVKYLDKFEIYYLRRSYYGEKDLLNLALTCRAFKEPALNVLWRAMWSVTPLFKLLPGYEAASYDEDKLRLALINGPISESDCETFLSYARRVKYLVHLDNFGGPPGRIHPSSYIRLSQAAGSFCLLPSLQYLTCGTSGPDLHYLLSPKLIAITLSPTHGDGRPVDFWMMTSELYRQAPDISHLVLEYNLSTSCSQYVPRMTGLKSLRLWNHAKDDFNLDTSFFKSFSSSSTLSELCIEGSISLLFDEPLRRSEVTFSNLTTMIFSTASPSIEQLANFLTMLELPRLQEFTFCCASQNIAETEATRWQKLFQCLARSTSSEFRSLEISGSQLDLTFADIPAIFDLQLTRLKIPEFLRTVTSKDVAAIVQGWPRLESLTIPYPIGFMSLIDIAKGLAKLRQLHIRLDCRNIPPIEQIPVLKNSLPFLTIMSPILSPPDAYDLAGGLDRLFPELETRTYTYFDSETFLTFWNDVNKLLSLQQRARRDQRLRDETSAKKLLTSTYYTNPVIISFASRA